MGVTEKNAQTPAAFRAVEDDVMNSTAVSSICPSCKEPLDGSSLNGMCARCMALDFFDDDPELAPERGMLMGDYEIFDEIEKLSNKTRGAGTMRIMGTVV